MAIVIQFQDIVQARRRRQQRACAERCIEIIDATLQQSRALFDVAPPAQRPLYARRIRHMSTLLEYAVRVL